MGTRALGRRAAAAGLLAVTCMILGLSRLRADVEASLRAALPTPALDLALSPFPARPGCWLVTSVEADEERDLYRVRRGAFAFPGLGETAAACLASLPAGATAPALPPQLPDTPQLAWRSRHDASLNTLRRLADSHCRFAAFLRFARAPFWIPPTPARPAWIYGDHRFDRDSELGFAEFLDPAGPQDDCEDLWVPGWGRPRADLLGGASGP